MSNVIWNAMRLAHQMTYLISDDKMTYLICLIHTCDMTQSYCNILQHILQHTATHIRWQDDISHIRWQHTATYCNTYQMTYLISDDMSMNESCPTYKWAMSHIRMGHATHMNLKSDMICIWRHIRWHLSHIRWHLSYQMTWDRHIRWNITCDMTQSYCNILQHILQHTATHIRRHLSYQMTWDRQYTNCSMLQYVAVCCSVLQYVAGWCSVLMSAFIACLYVTADV